MKTWISGYCMFGLFSEQQRNGNADLKGREDPED